MPRTEELIPTPEPDFGTGIYGFPLAARLISRGDRISVSTLRYWLRTGLTPATFGRGREGSSILSFHDVVSLEVVRLFREAKVSLQSVRLLEARLRERFPDLTRPFAHEIFFTDGSAIWHQLHPEDKVVIEIVGRRPDQAAWKPVIKSFAKEIHYEHGRAAVWHPHPAVEINPRVQFGAPVVRGTRLPLLTLKSELEVATAEEVAAWHGLDRSLIEGVQDYFAKAA
jgi:uncharacterized protein (DUF433 family)